MERSRLGKWSCRVVSYRYVTGYRGLGGQVIEMEGARRSYHIVTTVTKW